MTPPLAKGEYDVSWIYDPAPASVHTINLVNQAKNGEYAEDKLSDHIFGVILRALDEGGLIEEKNGTLCLQALFWHKNRKILSIHQAHEHIGHPFLGPDGSVLALKGRTLCGGASNLQTSNLIPTQVNAHSLVRKLTSEKSLHWPR